MSESPVATDLITQSTLAEVARDKIKLAILQSKLAPGAKLDQAVLARAYGISRMPIRDALRALSAMASWPWIPAGGLQWWMSTRRKWRISTKSEK